jgi:hypothetical protein
MGNSTRRIGLLTGGLVVAATTLTGCFQTYDNAYPEGDDVRLDMPGQFRAAGDRGEVYGVIEDTARDVNGTVAELVQGVGTVVAALGNDPETRMDGQWRVYGPFEDDKGRDLAWMVKIQGDATSTDYEVLVGDRSAVSAAEMDIVMEGAITIDGSERSGDFTLDFDAIEKHPAVKDPEDAGVTFAGSIDVEFSRDVDSEQKTVTIDFNDFSETAILGDAWFSDDIYAYERGAQGEGSFHLAVNGRWDEGAFGGMRVNRLELDARWNAAEQGRARGMVLDIENEDSGLPNGDLVINECFDAGGSLTYAGVNDAYRVEFAHYVDGDETSCKFGEEDL